MKIKNIRNGNLKKTFRTTILCLSSLLMIKSAFYLRNREEAKLMVSLNELSDSVHELKISREIMHTELDKLESDVDELYSFFDTIEAIIEDSQISKEQYLVNHGVYLIGTSVDIRRDAQVATTMYELVDDEPDLKPTYEANSNIGRENYNMVFMNAEGELRTSYDNETAYELLTSGYEFVGYCLENIYSTETEKEGYYRKEDVYCTEGQNLSLKRKKNL